MPAAPVPLWRQLDAAASILAAVRRGESATPALAKVAQDLRSAAQALAYQALRHLGRAEAIRKLLAKRPPPPQADALLCTALALCWNPKEEAASYEPFTLVDQAVEAAKRSPATKAQANFINACLRRLLREREALVQQTDMDPVARWNYPRWWIERIRRDHAQHWQQILQAGNAQAPMTLRVNTRRGTREAYAARLLDQGIHATPVGQQGLLLDRPRPVHDLPGFAEGDCSVQDAGAQLAAPLLLEGLGGVQALSGLEDGQDSAGPGNRQAGQQALRILDACAAPGGKTAHILELARADLLALDVDAQRCGRIHETLDRLGLQAGIQAADAARPQDWWDGRLFDAILLDAPCTASGIVRRHPDVRWLRRESDIAALAARPRELLDALWPLLRPSGRLVFCTCSVFREEGEGQVAAFVAHHSTALRLPAPGHLIPQSGENPGTVPDNRTGDHDGFFYAALEKTAAA